MATIKEVAERAGVSTATVSRVLNGRAIVVPETRTRILTAIEELNYRPSRVARNLRIQRTQLLGLIISDIQNPFFTSVITGVEDVAYQYGYSLLLCNSDEDPGREHNYLDIMHEENVAGIILATTSDSTQSDELLTSGIPVVAIDRKIGNLQIDTVLVDNVQGAYDAVTHLIKLGHTRIGLIGGPPQVSTAHERQLGYELAHSHLGILISPSYIKHGDFKQESGYQIALDLLSQTVKPSAFFVANNLMTLGALNAVHTLRLNIPKDIAIVGFDDMPWSISLNPPLTAVAQPTFQLGRTATELLLKRISSRDKEAELICLQPELIVRESCGSDSTVTKRGE